MRFSRLRGPWFGSGSGEGSGFRTDNKKRREREREAGRYPLPDFIKYSDLENDSISSGYCLNYFRWIVLIICLDIDHGKIISILNGIISDVYLIAVALASLEFLKILLKKKTLLK